MGTLRRDTELVGGMTSLHAGEVDSPHPKKWEPAQTFVLDVPIFFSLTLLAPSILWGVLRPWKPKFGAWLYSVSQVCLFFFSFISCLPYPLPTSFIFAFCKSVRKSPTGPGIWSLALHRAPYLSTFALRVNLKINIPPPYTDTPSVQSRPGSPPGGKGGGGGVWAFGKEHILPGLHWVPNGGDTGDESRELHLQERRPPHCSQGLALVPETGGVPSCEGQISICKMEGLHELGNCLTEPCIFHDLWSPSYL